MSDFYLELTQSPVGRKVVSSLGLPTPPTLARNAGPWADKPLTEGVVAIGAPQGARAAQACADIVRRLGGQAHAVSGFDNDPEVALEQVATPSSDDARGTPLAAAILDLTAIADVDDLDALYAYFSPIVRQVEANGRLIVLGTPPASARSVPAKTVARALEGFTRSLGKEFGKKGVTASLVYVQSGAEPRLAGPLRFILSAASAFVTGQVYTVTKDVKAPAGDTSSTGTWVSPLRGKTALVTGAGRGIGEAIATTLAREGATVVCLDRPGEEEALGQVSGQIGGKALAVDITAEDAPERIAEFLVEQTGGVDIVVHNAGVTRDKTLARMSRQWWDMVLDINLGAILKINERLARDVIHDGGRIVCVSSIGGIAGNYGQTNYATSKAGIIGYVDALSNSLAKRGIAVNAVAPGFIETRMTAAMPFGVREAGRRLNALSQGGVPGDVAELIAFLSTPGAVGVSGQTIRVCGQNLVGA